MNKKKMMLFGGLSIAFACIALSLGISAACALWSAPFYDWNTILAFGFTTMIISTIQVVSIIFIIFSLTNNKKYAFVALIIENLSVLWLLGSMSIYSTSYAWRSVFFLTLFAGIALFTSVIMLSIYFFNAPKRLIQQGSNNIIKRINTLNAAKKHIKKLFDKNILSENEYNLKKEEIIIKIKNIIEDGDINSNSKDELLIGSAGNFEERITIKSRKGLAILLTPAIILLLVVIIAPIISSALKAKCYANLEYNLENSGSLYEIDDCLAYLPSNYQNCREIATQFYVLRQYLERLHYNDYYERNCRMARESYVWLLSNKNQYDLINIDNYLKNANIALLIGYVDWNGVIYHFELSGEQLRTNIPSDKQLSSSYGFYRKYLNDGSILIGYINDFDSNDQFIAYKIYDFTVFSRSSYRISIYSYKENKIYYLWYE